MDIKGTHRFQAPRERVWHALMDPHVLSQALPGGDELKEVGENEYSAAMNVRVGPVQGKFAGKVHLSDIEAPTGYKMEVDGSGTAGFVQGVGTLQLEEDGDETVLEYAGEVQVGGRLASVGQRLIESTAKSLIRQGLRSLDAHLQPANEKPVEKRAKEPAKQSTPPQSEQKHTPPSPSSASTKDTAASTAPQAPSPQGPGSQTSSPSAVSIAAEVAKDVARDLASDYVSPSRQDKIAYTLLGASLMLLFVILVRLVQRG